MVMTMIEEVAAVAPAAAARADSDDISREEGGG